MADNQYVGLNKIGVATAKWKGGTLFICSDGTYLWSNDNLFTFKILKKEVYRGQVVKRLGGTTYRIGKGATNKMAVTRSRFMI
tara:strand:- start:2438 stop:2686 length:249 start_codon:yes stop_codon:yes gene_type:complete